MTRTPCRFPVGPLLRRSGDLEVADLASEEVRHLMSARVALAEYDVLQHDFAELRTDQLLLSNPEITELCSEEQELALHSLIDEWLLANAAYVSMAQAAQAVVNTPIDVDGNLGLAYRPPRYGRAIVVSTRAGTTARTNGGSSWSPSEGLLDLKGAGVAPDRVPRDGIQSNGLEYLGLALSDFLVKKVIDEIFARTLPSAWTVPVYAVLDLGFDILCGFHGIGQAGMHVRRAHRRRIGVQPSPAEQMAALEIESVLRRHGLTAAGRDLQLHVTRHGGGHITWQIGSKPPIVVQDPERVAISLALLGDAIDQLTLDRRDVQLARDVSFPPTEAQMVDFGAIRVEPDFDCPMLRRFDKTILNEVIWPTDPTFVHPDSDLLLPLEIWNRYKLKSLCFDLAQQFRRDGISSVELRRQLDDMLLALTVKWQSAGLKAPRLFENGDYVAPAATLPMGS